MRRGGTARRGFRRAAVALVALTLLPVAVMATTARGPAALSAAGAGGPTTVRVQDVELPSAEAIHRGQASNLFAPFTWDGLVASGPFVRFDYLPDQGMILDYFAVNGSEMTDLLDSVQVPGFAPIAPPLVSGATFAVASNNVVIVAHDEPTGLLEIRTLGHPQNVTLRFPGDTTGLQVSRSTSWPASSLSFTDGSNSGRILLGRGSLVVDGTNVTATLGAQDYLALRAVPGFVEHAAERTAILDAFASGHLAAEFELVAVANGGWLENSARYEFDLGAVDSSVRFNRASVTLGNSSAKGGLVLLAFDPKTMPADDQHRLVVRANGTEIPQTSDPLASLFALPGSADQAAYVRLSMNATVLAIYMPNLSSASLQVESLSIPAPGLDRPTQLAIVAAMFIVAVAAAIMFRPRSS